MWINDSESLISVNGFMKMDIYYVPIQLKDYSKEIDAKNQLFEDWELIVTYLKFKQERHY